MISNPCNVDHESNIPSCTDTVELIHTETGGCGETLGKETERTLTLASFTKRQLTPSARTTDFSHNRLVCHLEAYYSTSSHTVEISGVCHHHLASLYTDESQSILQSGHCKGVAAV